MPHASNIVFCDGPDSPHAFDVVPLQPRNGSLDAMCLVCKGRGQWNTEIDLVSFRCKRTGCDRCLGRGSDGNRNRFSGFPGHRNVAGGPSSVDDPLRFTGERNGRKSERTRTRKDVIAAAAPGATAWMLQRSHPPRPRPGARRMDRQYGKGRQKALSRTGRRHHRRTLPRGLRKAI